jgi:hypothetical protein
MEFYAELSKISDKIKKCKDVNDIKKILITLGINIENLIEKKDKKGGLYFEIPLST